MPSGRLLYVSCTLILYCRPLPSAGSRGLSMRPVGILASWVREVVRMSNAAESARPQATAEVSIEDLARQQGVRAVESLDELARPSSWESDDEFEDFLIDLYHSRRSDIS